MVLVAIGLGVGAGLLATDAGAAAHAVANAGPDLTRLLRAMAGLKLLMAAGVTAVVLWRLGVGISLPWLAAYALACAAMAAGPVLIWDMAHVGAGALLLHGGLFATVVLLWRDKATAHRLHVAVAARRAARQAFG